MNKKAKSGSLKRIGPVTKKVLLLLFAGAALSLTRNPLYSFRILKTAGKEWQKIDREALYDTIKNLYRSKLVSAKENPDGTVEIVLSGQGKKKALVYKIETMRLPRQPKWDDFWRMVIFDIPEKNKKGRDAFSRTLKRAGFHKLQKSVFIYPYDCQNEINFLIEFFDLRPFVRVLLVKDVDNALHLKNIFHLT